jgi:hypothetical protein
MIHVLDFFTHNHRKRLTIKVWFWAGLYRVIILIIPAKLMKKHYGILGEESSYCVSEDNERKARMISYQVNRVAMNTPWESKCLVRALTAQKLLSNENISSTLYLGIKKENEKMLAHAWIRTGDFYLTGGDGKEYAIVARFRK